MPHLPSGHCKYKLLHDREAPQSPPANMSMNGFWFSITSDDQQLIKQLLHGNNSVLFVRPATSDPTTIAKRDPTSDSIGALTSPPNLHQREQSIEPWIFPFYSALGSAGVPPHASTFIADGDYQPDSTMAFFGFVAVVLVAGGWLVKRLKRRQQGEKEAAYRSVV